MLKLVLVVLVLVIDWNIRFSGMLWLIVSMELVMWVSM